MELLDVLRDISQRLNTAGVPSPSVDAERLASHVLGIPRGEVLARAHRGGELDAHHLEALEALVVRREKREPLQHLTGNAPFLSFEVSVGPGVFVPRPETESMALRAIGQAQTLAVGEHGLRVLDLCAGSGVLGIAIAREVPHAQVTAVEVSPEAFGYLEINSQALAPENTLVKEDLGSFGAQSLDDSFDLVVANPPYVPKDLVPNDPEVADFDPPLALFGGDDGLDVVREILGFAPVILRPGGVIMIEHSNLQGELVKALLHDAGFRAISTGQDLVGRDRFTQGFLP